MYSCVAGLVGGSYTVPNLVTTILGGSQVVKNIHVHMHFVQQVSLLKCAGT